MKHKFQLFFLAIVMCFVILAVKDYIDSRPIIVFIGGGSAKNYINDSFMKDQTIEKYAGSFYINVPSNNAWLTLVEEIARYDKTHYKNKPTAIVCLSADAIDADTVFMKKEIHKRFLGENRIVGIELGADELIVYRKGSIEKLGLEYPNSISVDKLKSIIMNNSEKIYATKKGSGTLNAYGRLIKDSVAKKILEDSISKRFYDFFTENDFEKDSTCLILGSKYYKPSDNSLYSMEINGITNIKKPICVYFATYPDDHEFYKIPEPICKFIKIFKFGIDDDVWEKIENSGNWQEAAKRLPHNKNSCILYLNHTLQYIKPFKNDTASGK